MNPDPREASLRAFGRPSGSWWLHGGFFATVFGTGVSHVIVQLR